MPWTSRPEEARFLEKADKQPNGCWLWTAHIGQYGYGTFSRLGGKISSAHRASWMIFRGEIPPGICVCHRCDVRHCVNPDHLFLGTSQDNTRDRVAKGRTASGDRNGRRTKPENWPTLRGEDNAQAKLTAAQVRAIRADSRTIRKIAADYGIAYSNVRQIKARLSWQHV